MKSSVCLGAEVLMKLLGNYCRNVDVKTSITVGVVGMSFTEQCIDVHVTVLLECI